MSGSNYRRDLHSFPTRRSSDLYGTFSVFINAAVILIWKFPLTFSQQATALSIAHLFVLAIGAFLLARDRRLSIPLSIFVALVAALNGWIICWGATDWFGALGAF